jgi:hypothetical protein
MSATNELANETRKADVNLPRFISNDRWQRIQDNAAHDHRSGEWVREKILRYGFFAAILVRVAFHLIWHALYVH